MSCLRVMAFFAEALANYCAPIFSPATSVPTTLRDGQPPHSTILLYQEDAKTLLFPIASTSQTET